MADPKAAKQSVAALKAFLRERRQQSLKSKYAPIHAPECEEPKAEIPDLEEEDESELFDEYSKLGD